MSPTSRSSSLCSLLLSTIRATEDLPFMLITLRKFNHPPSESIHRWSMSPEKLVAIRNVRVRRLILESCQKNSARTSSGRQSARSIILKDLVHPAANHDSQNASRAAKAIPRCGNNVLQIMMWHKRRAALQTKAHSSYRNSQSWQSLLQ